MYVGQTGRNFKVTFQEHICGIKNNRDDSKHVAHISNNKHSYGPIDQVMAKTDHTNKGQLMNIKERLHIYLNKKGRSLINKNMKKVNV
jgi:hypothetical protein